MQEPFEDAVARHGATVLRVCRAVLGPGADADDAWSETFLAALTAWPTLATDTNVAAWLVTVARRKAIDITRARARRAVPTDELPDRASADGSPGDGAVWAAVAALPERQRLAVAYHYFGGLPHAETAELIGGSTDSVRRASADGIASLRRAYRVAAESRTGDRSRRADRSHAASHETPDETSDETSDEKGAPR